jgi:hypothetical protein
MTWLGELGSILHVAFFKTQLGINFQSVIEILVVILLLIPLGGERVG